MSVILGVTVFFVALILLVLWCACYLRREKKRNAKANGVGPLFDERQTEERSKAWEFSSIVAFVYYGIVSIILMTWQYLGKEPLIEPSILVSGGIMLALLSFFLYCVMTDSALPLKHNNVVSAVLCMVNGSLMVVGVVLGAYEGGMPLKGNDSFRWIILFYGLTIISIGAIYFAACFRDKRESE